MKKKQIQKKILRGKQTKLKRLEERTVLSHRAPVKKIYTVDEGGQDKNFKTSEVDL